MSSSITGPGGSGRLDRCEATSAIGSSHNLRGRVDAGAFRLAYRMEISRSCTETHASRRGRTIMPFERHTCGWVLERASVLHEVPPARYSVGGCVQRTVSGGGVLRFRAKNGSKNVVVSPEWHEDTNAEI